jgi:hypothetical protein
VKRWYEVSGPLPLWIGQGQLKNTVAPVRQDKRRSVEQDVKVFAMVLHQVTDAASDFHEEGFMSDGFPGRLVP